MIQTVVGRYGTTPKIASACEWGEQGIILAHEHGLITVLEDDHLMCTIQTQGQEVVYMRALDRTVFVSFSTGLFANYSLPMGILQHCVQLPGPISGFFLEESSIITWGTAAQVIFLNRFSLDIENTLEFDSKPVRVCRDSRLAVVLRSGCLHWIEDRTPSEAIQLPLDSGSFNHVLDIACIDQGKWVCIQRDKWSILQELEGVFHLEFNASGPDLLRGLMLSNHVSTFTIICDSGQLLLVEGNNIQVLEPAWSAYMIRGLIYYKHRPLVILENSEAFIAALDNQVWNWTSPEFSSLVGQTPSTNWILSGRYVAQGHIFGKFSSICNLHPLYECDEEICSMLVYGDTAYLGLKNGSVDILKETKGWKRVQRVALINMPIRNLLAKGRALVAWSEHTIALYVAGNDFPTIIPTRSCIENVKLESGTLYIGSRNKVQSWDLINNETHVAASTLSFPPISSITVFNPYVESNFSPSELEDQKIGFRVSMNGLHSVTLFSHTPKFTTAAAIYTLMCAHGMSLNKADQELRDMGITAEHFEELLVLLNHRNEKLCTTATNLLQSLTDNRRMESLMKLGGVRPTLIFSAIYPNVPVGDWLKKSVFDLLNGDVTERLVALDIISHHTDLCEFPFQTLSELAMKSAVWRFIETVASSSLEYISKALSIELGKPEHKYFGLCVECIDCMISQSLITVDDNHFISLVGAVCRAVHSAPSGKSLVRNLLSRTLHQYPDNVLFNKQRQIFFVHSAAIRQGVCAILWELLNGHQIMLANPNDNENGFKFSSDARAVIAGKSVWKLPGAIASFFTTQNIVQPEYI